MQILYLICVVSVVLEPRQFSRSSLLEKAKLAKEINDGKNEIPHKFLGHKI